MLEQELQKLGFSDKEARIYLTSLQLGPNTIQEISRKSGIMRTTAYNLIKTLRGRQLVSENINGKRRLFAAESPDKLLSLIGAQKADLEDRERDLRTIMSELKSMVDFSRGLPRVRFFEGKDGIRQMQDDVINTENLTHIEEFIPMDEAHRLFPPHQRDHRHKMRRALNRLERKVIYTSKRGPVLPEREKLVERRFIPADKFPLASEINVYGNKVSIVTFGRKPSGIIIESKEVADSGRVLFEWIWVRAEKRQN